MSNEWESKDMKSCVTYCWVCFQ